jgi:hypothetical protein
MKTNIRRQSCHQQAFWALNLLVSALFAPALVDYAIAQSVGICYRFNKSVCHSPARTFVAPSLLVHVK